ncbi:vacuolar fusion protein ccz1 [Dimargaris verticillata]|uniref:Vacuolar fusion protein ccz1 n=1 Tax=Dimargaris verticillata TaxID=2761393 RepID=A0A9W8B879_9FUNG|nr:vacuolar fusion protein ccz1 [Dimargaris verticillata]
MPNASAGCYVTPALAYFTIFNPTLKSDEDSEHEQLLYYAASAHHPASSLHRTTDPAGGPPTAASSWSGYLWSGLRSGPLGSARSDASPALPMLGTSPTAGPAAVPLDAKIRQIGLVQGLVHCASTFASDPRWHSVHTQKSRIVIYRPEQDFWIALTSTIEYHPQEFSDDDLAAHINQSYQIYCLLYGPLSLPLSSAASHPLAARTLRRSLETFYDGQIWTWRFGLPSLDLMLNGIPSQMTSRPTWIEFESLFHDIQSQAQPATAMVVLWQHSLVWSTGLDAPVAQTVYWYLVQRYSDRLTNTVDRPSSKTTTLWSALTPLWSSQPTGTDAIPAHGLEHANTRPLQNDVLDSSLPGSTALDEFEYLVALTSSTASVLPAPPSDAKRRLKPKRPLPQTLPPGDLLHVGVEHQPHRCVVAVLTEPSTGGVAEPTASQEVGVLNERIRDAVVEYGPTLTAALRQDQAKSQAFLASPSLKGFQYVHLNYLNLALHTSWSRALDASQQGPAVLQCIRGLRERFERYPSLQESAICTFGDGWVAGIRTNEAEMYVIVDKPGSNLVTVDDCLHRVHKHFINPVV